jgi:hypothetical protein
VIVEDQEEQTKEVLVFLREEVLVVDLEEVLVVDLEKVLVDSEGILVPDKALVAEGLGIYWKEAVAEEEGSTADSFAVVQTQVLGFLATVVETVEQLLE